LKNRANKAIHLLSTLTQRVLSEVQTGNMAPLSGRNAKLTRLFLQSLPEAEKTAFFERLQQGHIQTLVSILERMPDESLANFLREVDRIGQSAGKPSLYERLQDEAA
jgi:hypothetical protein